MQNQNVWVRIDDQKKLGMITSNNDHQKYLVFLPSEKKQVLIRKQDILSKTNRTSDRIEDFNKRKTKRTEKKKNSTKSKISISREGAPHYEHGWGGEYIIITEKNNSEAWRTTQFLKKHNLSYDLVTYPDIELLFQHLCNPELIPNVVYGSTSSYLQNLFRLITHQYKAKENEVSTPIIGKTSGSYISYIEDLTSLKKKVQSRHLKEKKM